jgi:hypothetical protein
VVCRRGGPPKSKYSVGSGADHFARAGDGFAAFVGELGLAVGFVDGEVEPLVDERHVAAVVLQVARFGFLEQGAHAGFV